MVRISAGVLAGLCAGLVGSAAEAQPAELRSPTPAPSRWADSQVWITASANGSFFDRRYVLAGERLAVFDLHLSLYPRFRFHRMFQVRASWGFGMELTNSDTTTTTNELRTDDPGLSVWFDGTPVVAGLHFAAAASLVFPVSPESRAATTILTPGLLAQLHWEARIPHGTFHAIARVGWAHVFYSYTTSGIRGSFPYQRQCFGGSNGDCSGQLFPHTNVHDQLSWNLTLAPAWGMWSPGVYFGMFHQWAFDTPLVGTGFGSEGDHTRTFTSFAAWLDLSPAPWFTVEAGYSLTRNVLDADGTYGNPFFSKYQDWRVYLVANFVLDRLADAGRPGDARGIVRW